MNFLLQHDLLKSSMVILYWSDCSLVEINWEIFYNRTNVVSESSPITRMCPISKLISIPGNTNKSINDKSAFTLIKLSLSTYFLV